MRSREHDGGGALIAALAILCLGTPAFGQGRDQRFEEALLARLKERSPAAAEAFRRATTDLDAQRHTAADAGYREVLRLVPDHAPSLRRLSYLAGGAQETIDLAERALKLEDLPENQAAVLLALVKDPAIRKARSAVAHRLAEKLLARAPAERTMLISVAQAAIALNASDLLSSAVAGLRRHHPDDPATHLFAGIHLGQSGDLDGARRALLAARRLGIPATMVDPLLAQLRPPPPPPSVTTKHAGLLRTLLWASVGWAAGLVLLLLVGLILSWRTLSAVERASPEATGEPSGGIRTLRRFYALVLGVTSVYFYLSFPFVFLLLLGAGGGLIYLFFAIGYIPVKLVLLIVIVVLVTVWAMLKSLFIRVKDEDPGEPLPEARAPGLWAMLRDLSGRVGTRPVDAVYVVPDATVAVYERGGVLRRLTGRTERVLVLGIGVLDGMTRLQLEAILAHEYGHFSNQDTAGGGLALHVRRSVLNSAQAMAEGGAAGWYNPAWLFLSAFHRIYLRVSQGASRLQEVLADRWAALACGARAFGEGLTHVVRRSVEFDLLVNREVNEALAVQRLTRNLYSLRADPAAPMPPEGEPLPPTEDPPPPQVDAEGRALVPVPPAVIDRVFHEAMEEEASAYDSHPTPQQRIAWVNRLALAPQVEDDATPAWSLIADRVGLEASMTELINAQVRLVLAHNGLVPTDPVA